MLWLDKYHWFIQSILKKYIQYFASNPTSIIIICFLACKDAIVILLDNAGWIIGKILHIFFNVDWINQWYLFNNEASRHSIYFKSQPIFCFILQNIKISMEIWKYFREFLDNVRFVIPFQLSNLSALQEKKFHMAKI